MLPSVLLAPLQKDVTYASGRWQSTAIKGSGPSAELSMDTSPWVTLGLFCELPASFSPPGK